MRTDTIDVNGMAQEGQFEFPKRAFGGADNKFLDE